jgi:hypothetical protein
LLHLIYVEGDTLFRRNAGHFKLLLFRNIAHKLSAFLLASQALAAMGRRSRFSGFARASQCASRRRLARKSQ